MGSKPMAEYEENDGRISIRQKIQTCEDIAASLRRDSEVINNGYQKVTWTRL